MTRVEIGGLAPCGCRDHAHVRLECPEQPDALRTVRVETALAHAILGELNAIPGPCSVLIDMLAGVLGSLGLEVAELSLHDLDGERPAGRLQLTGNDGPRVIQAPAGPALLIAARLRCPVVIAEDETPGQAPEPPAAFRDFLASLDLTRLERD